ncbi:unnamed protein product [Dovyalis caffra]|uniref:Cytochrome P450 n=1 Tax=Dovyalis caffra TaxID=77055 RepID=A0AAV1SIB5_9ROSI|nr:unnamed protein product [Dovyalis caffra]
MVTHILFCLLVFLFSAYLFWTEKTSKRLPPGSLGLPIIGQSLSFLNALRKNTAEGWLQDRIRKYGPISKMNILGTPTVFLHGQAANKFVFTYDGNILANQQPSSIRRICGEKNILELSGHDHKRMRGALLSFLKPDVLRQYVSKMDKEIRKHFELHWRGKNKAMPSMKTLTFNVMSSLLIGIEQGAKRDVLLHLFDKIMEGILSVPINLPFTRFNRSLQARAKIRTILMDLIQEKRAALEHGTAFPQQDLITTLLSLRNEDNSVALSDEEIVDSLVLIMIAGYDTTSTLLSFLIRISANDPSVYASMIQEQEEISKSKACGELLTWDDLARMKCTWRVAMESLRMTPPALTLYRKVLKDFEYEGYLIPKGWQVMLSTSMTHMDDNIFPDASKFDPKHFEIQGSVPPYSFVALEEGLEYVLEWNLQDLKLLLQYIACYKSCNPFLFAYFPSPDEAKFKNASTRFFGIITLHSPTPQLPTHLARMHSRPVALEYNVKMGPFEKSTLLGPKQAANKSIYACDATILDDKHMLYFHLYLMKMWNLLVGQ